MGVGAEQNSARGLLLEGLARANADRRARTRAVLAAAGLEDVLSEAGQRAGRLADELRQASRANRGLVENLIAEEVARAADRWGFVRSEELEELRREVDELRVALVKATLDTPVANGSDAPAAPATSDVAAPKPARKRAPARSTSRAARPQQHPLGGVDPEAVAPDRLSPEPAGAAAAEDQSGSQP